MIHELFEAQVEWTPDNVAVVFEEQELTYRELNARANGLARVLREKGVQPDRLVGIMVERSLDMIVGIMAILKAGGAYVPIDPAYPEDRIRYMLDDSGAELLLTHRQSKQYSFLLDRTVLFIDNPAWSTEEQEDLRLLSQADHLAYVMYTSGTTGKPKGVMIEHGLSSLRLVRNQGYVALSEMGRTSLAIGGGLRRSTIFELFGALLNGGAVYPIPKMRCWDSDVWQLLKDNQITTMFLTPGLFNLFAQEEATDVRWNAKSDRRRRELVCAGF